MDRSVLDRIRKLLALGQSSNAHEAASALAHAQRLMSEHDLSVQDLDAADIELHGCDDSAMSRARRPPGYENALANMLKEAFGVLVVRRADPGQRICFYGPAVRAQVAAHCYVVLLRKLVAARREYMLGAFWSGQLRHLGNAGDVFALHWIRSVHQVVDRVFLSDREERAVTVWQERNLGRLVDNDGRAPHGRGIGDAAAEGRRQGGDVDLFRSMSGQDPLRLGGGR